MNQPVERIFIFMIYITARIHCLAPFRYDYRARVVIPSLLATVQTAIMGIIFIILTPLSGEYVTQRVTHFEKAPILINIISYITSGFEYLSIGVIFILIIKDRHCYVNTLNHAFVVSDAIDDLREMTKPYLKRCLRYLQFRFASVLFYGAMMSRGFGILPNEDVSSTILLHLAFGWYLYSHIAVITISIFYYTAINFNTQYMIMINNRIRIIMKSIEFISNNKEVTTEYERMSKYEEFSIEIDYLSCIYSEVVKILQGFLQIFTIPITLIFGSYIMQIVAQVNKILYSYEFYYSIL